MNTFLLLFGVVFFLIPFVWSFVGPRLHRRMYGNQRRIEQKLDALLEFHGMAIPCKLSAEVQRLAMDPKRKVAAVKLYHDQNNVSLVEAKRTVEDFISGGLSS